MNIERIKQLRAFIAELPKSACNMNLVLARTTDPDTFDFISSEKMRRLVPKHIRPMALKERDRN